MADTVYSKKIFSVEVLPKDGGLENVVIRVQWEFQARNFTHYAVTVHRTELSPVSDTGNFVPFHELTENMVLGWIESRVDTAALQAELDALILTEMQKPEVQKNPPWFDPNDNILTKLYVVVKDGDVIWGPARWNAALINAALSAAGVKETLPNAMAVIPENAPTIINDITSAYQVHSLGHEEYNPFVERLTPNFLFEEFSGKAIVTQKKEAIDLEQAKQEIALNLQEKYLDNVKFKKDISSDDVLIIPHSEISELAGLLVVSNSEDTFEFRTENNTLVSYNQDQFFDLVKECLEYYKNEKAVLNSRLIKVSQCESADEILKAIEGMGL